MDRKKVIIIGAAGRDFHNFNVYYKNNPNCEVVAFTAAQIPDIDDRLYPPKLSGDLYKEGIPIYPEEKLLELIKKYNVDEVVLSYSDLSHDAVMEKASMALSYGVDFKLLSPQKTMIESTKPIISVCAVRTGTGKSQTTRKISEILKEKGKKVVAIRHPMPYGDLLSQKCQRFASYNDLDTCECSIEEREEYEPHIDRGTIVYAGVDYESILRQAEKEADIILWDGGNNDTPFYKPTLAITVADPLRPGHEMDYYPGQINVRMADVVIINKVDTATREDINVVESNLRSLNPDAIIIEAESPITLEKPEYLELIKGKRVLVVEDGPTLTHGDMSYGAGYIAAKNSGAKEIIDPRPFAVGSIKATFEKYDHLSYILPAMGYGDVQVKELEQTINNSNCDVVIAGTPIDLNRILKVNKPILRVKYDLKEISSHTLADIIEEKVLSVN